MLYHSCTVQWCNCARWNNFCTRRWYSWTNKWCRPDKDFHFSTSNQACSLYECINLKRIQFRVAATVHRCLKGFAPVYLSELYIPPAQNQSRHRLRSSYRNYFPLVKLSTYGSRSFAFCGPTVWNKLPDYLRNPSLSIDIFTRDLKTFLFAHYWLTTLERFKQLHRYFTLILDCSPWPLWKYYQL